MAPVLDPDLVDVSAWSEAGPHAVQEPIELTEAPIARLGEPVIARPGCWALPSYLVVLTLGRHDPRGASVHRGILPTLARALADEVSEGLGELEDAWVVEQRPLAGNPVAMGVEIDGAVTAAAETARGDADVADAQCPGLDVVSSPGGICGEHRRGAEQEGDSKQQEGRDTRTKTHGRRLMGGDSWEETHGTLLAATGALRIPVEYAAELFPASDIVPVDAVGRPSVPLSPSRFPS